MTAKWQFIRQLYQQEKAAFLADPDFQLFRDEQKSWLMPYAAFCGLRDRFGTADFSQWPEEYRTPAEVAELTREDEPPTSTSSACTSSPSTTSISSCATP